MYKSLDLNTPVEDMANAETLLKLKEAWKHGPGDMHPCLSGVFLESLRRFGAHEDCLSGVMVASGVEGCGG